VSNRKDHSRNDRKVAKRERPEHRDKYADKSMEQRLRDLADHFNGRRNDDRR
jgi:hypothetical protein